MNTQVLAQEKCAKFANVGTWRLAWIDSIFTSASRHSDKGIVWQLVVTKSSQKVDWWTWKGDVDGGTQRGYFGSSYRYTRKRTAVRAATFLEKVKAHQGEPANKGADILAQKAISDPKKGGVLNPWDNLQFWEIALATTSEEGVVPADDSSSDSIRKPRATRPKQSK